MIKGDKSEFFGKMYDELVRFQVEFHFHKLVL